MPQNIQEERYRWIKPLLEKELTYQEVLRNCPYSKRSLERWVQAYKEDGMSGLIPQSTKPKTHPKETSIHLKEEVISLRKETGLCAKKLHWKLTKQGVHIHERTIGKILKAEGLTKRYRKRKIKYTYVKVQRLPGELIEIDVKYVPGKIKGRRYYQYTAIDTASRWRYLKIYDEQSSYHSVCFLREVQKQFPYPISAIKTDNHSTFTNYYLGTMKRSELLVKRLHTLDEYCISQNMIHYLIDPGKPTQNGTIERSHREDSEKFYGVQSFSSVLQLKRRLRKWDEYYNDLEHCGLNGKTPNEMLQLE